MLGSDRGRLIEQPYDNTEDLQPFYQALRERINAHEQAAATVGPPLSSPNATFFAPNVGGSPLDYEDPFLKGGEGQHPGSGVTSIMPYQRQGIGPQGNPYQRQEGPAANAPFTGWEDQEPQGLSRVPHSMMQPASRQRSGFYDRINQTKKDNWQALREYLRRLTDLKLSF
jgi:hypothetical protein